MFCRRDIRGYKVPKKFLHLPYTWTWALSISQEIKCVQDTKFRPCHSCVGPNLSHTHSLSHSLSLITQTRHLCTSPRAAGLGFDTTTTTNNNPSAISPQVSSGCPITEKAGEARKRELQQSWPPNWLRSGTIQQAPKLVSPLFFLSPSLFFCPLGAACYKSDVLSVVTSIELGIDCSFGK